jgi:hypothetical protein
MTNFTLLTIATGCRKVSEAETLIVQTYRDPAERQGTDGDKAVCPRPSLAICVTGGLPRLWGAVMPTVEDHRYPRAGESSSGWVVFDVPSPHGYIVYAPNADG